MAPISTDFLEGLGHLDNQWWYPASIHETKSKMRSDSTARILPVDDDPLFCKTVARAARNKPIRLTTCSSLQELNKLPHESHFDVALVDYYLGDNTAPEVIPLFTPEMPVVLISESGKDSLAKTHWPDPIKRFVPKNVGPEMILSEALRETPLSQTNVSAFSDTFLSSEKSGFLIWNLFLLALGVAMLVLVSWLADSVKARGPERSLPIPLRSTPAPTFEVPPIEYPIPFRHFQWDGAPIDKGSDEA